MAEVATQYGPYMLHKLVSDLPLSADGPSTDVHITCVQVSNGNLYVGTSAAEIIHFVLLPPEPSDFAQEPTAIIASRLEPPHNDRHGPGIQQILLLPNVNKACVLCNNTLSLYSLPELSPDSTFKSISCLWVGGADINEQGDSNTGEYVEVVIGQKKRLRLVQISEDSPPRAPLKPIEYGGCLLSVRRDNFSCTADAHAYALLDVANQQKIGLFPISSLDPDAGDVGGATESLATVSHTPSRNMSSVNSSLQAQQDPSVHSRNTSLSLLGLGLPTSKTTSPRGSSQRNGFNVPETRLGDLYPPAMSSPAQTQKESETVQTGSAQAESAATIFSNKPLPNPPEEVETQTDEISPPSLPPFIPLKPHIASPSPNEFLLTVGTTPSEPGVGMFVNLDGDMCRGSIQFSSYPDAIIVDGSGMDMTAPIDTETDAEEGYVLAAVRCVGDDTTSYGVEIQRWDIDPSAAEATKALLPLSYFKREQHNEDAYVSTPLGLSTVVQPYDVILPEIGAKLTIQKLQLTPLEETSTLEKLPTVQGGADREFAERLSRIQTQNVIWSGDQICWVVRTPLVIRLDSRIQEAQYTRTGDGRHIQPNRGLLEKVLGDIRGQEPRNEAEYLSLIYVRQKASLMLFMDVVLRTKTNIIIFESEKRITELALIEGELDPRVVLSLLPILNEEVDEGPDGIQISGGITTLVEQFLQQNKPSTMSTDINGPFGDNLLHFVKRYLQFWRKRKGMASVTNDPFIFRTIDAALLHILLLLDQSSLRGISSPGTHRAELNDLVDKEIKCLDRAVELLERFKRLFLLSRLYQSNCKASLKASKVLATWKRILEGEEDEGGEFIDGEQRVREHLARIRDQALVEEYGSWLANRNPMLGVQVFADDHSKVKFEPARAVALLREKAPGAVKHYLEYLVFGKQHTQYINELIAFYLDTVITELESNPSTRDTLSQTYETYRILHSPKPTYHSFIADNALAAEWWQVRLRLLQLLGADQSSTSSYDVSTILARLQPYEQDLVPEMIILHGRQEQHQEALRLLTHGLADFNTAISYCLYGYSSIFRPITSGILPIPQSQLPSRAEQSHLFDFLLIEFLRIEDLAQRVEQTSDLLERFAAWFDIGAVLAVLPDEWSVDIFRSFLVASLRKIVREKAEADIVRALCDAQNSVVSNERVVEMERVGPTVEKVGG